MMSAGISFATLVTPACAQVTFSVFVDPHPVAAGGTIGFAYAGNKFVGSVQGDGLGILYATDLSGSNVRLFAPWVQIPGPNSYSEHYIASGSGLGGYPKGDIYVASGDGVIHISSDGERSRALVSGLPSPVEAILFDTVGTFGYQMIVSTTLGQIYRVDHLGRAMLVASIGQRAEGLDIAPIGSGFGDFDGQLITVSESDGLLRAVSIVGGVTVLNGGNPIPDPENIRFVPHDLGSSGSSIEGLYAANYPGNVVKAPWSQFEPFRGDAIVMTELADRRISRVHWNGGSFEISVIGHIPDQAEDAFFLSPAMISGGGCTPVDPPERSGDGRGRRPRRPVGHVAGRAAVSFRN